MRKTSFIANSLFLKRFIYSTRVYFSFSKNSSISPFSPLPYLLSSSVRKLLHYKIITRNKKWNYEEDNILLRRVIRYGWKHWGIISQGFTNRSSLDCYYRYRYGLKYLIDYSYINQSSIMSLTLKEQQQFWKNLSKTNNLKQTLQLRTNSSSLLKKYFIDMQKFSREQQQLSPVNYNSVLQISKKINENNGVTRKPWTKDETKRLVYLLSNYASLDNQLLFSRNSCNKGKSTMYNWKLISSTYFPNRTLNDVKDKWHNIQTRIPWTKQEDQIIIDGVKQFGEKDQWDKIALKINSIAPNSTISSDFSSLLTSAVRSPSQCMVRWRDTLKPLQSKQKKFSEFEHLILVKALKEVSLKGNQIDWKSIHQYYLPNRTPLQLYKHYYNVICKPAKWNLQEDELLLKTIKEYCHQSEAQENSQETFPLSLRDNDVWKRIAQNIPGRTAIQCRNRYIDTLNPSLKKGRYTAEDHFQLFMSIKKNGHRWSLVAKEMGRSKVAIAKLYSIWKCRRKVSRIRINKGGINSIYSKLLSHI
ncbi:unnamed protein product [Rhizophagus irregularis]|nr:unnamed protein product [Rhizophagus irregularis]CAB5367223.1 unnamed protein product [Rhizophagus irregularis]